MKTWSFKIEGAYFSTIQQVIGVARSLGFDGCGNTIRRRLKRGANTWEELIAAPKHQKSEAGKVLKTMRNKEKTQMAQLCAELDARKSALKEQK